MPILITKDTTFIVQGITGREAVNLTREGLDYGTKIVGGVTPGRAGRDVYGVPVYDCVRDITKKQQIDASIVTVPPKFTRDAVFEAIDSACKAANVEVIGKEKLGGGYVTVIIRGDVAAVKAAVEAGVAKVGSLGKLIAGHVIARPSAAVLSLLPKA